MHEPLEGVLHKLCYTWNNFTPDAIIINAYAAVCSTTTLNVQQHSRRPQPPVVCNIMRVLVGTLTSNFLETPHGRSGKMSRECDWKAPHSSAKRALVFLLLVAVAGPVATMARGLAEADQLLAEPPVELDTESGSTNGLQVTEATGGDVRTLPFLVVAYYATGSHHLGTLLHLLPTYGRDRTVPHPCP